MSIPIFALDQPGILGLGDPNLHTGEFAAPKTLFGKVERFYVHGQLQDDVCYDIADFVAGDFLDLPEQDAKLVDNDGKVHDACIIMVTSDKGKKYAFLVTRDTNEKEKARKSLHTGEWLENGKERF